MTAPTVMAGAADTSWRVVVLTMAATTLETRLSPLWLQLVGAALGGLGLL